MGRIVVTEARQPKLSAHSDWPGLTHEGPGRDGVPALPLQARILERA